ncbi:putative disks large-like protein 2 isoform X2 [Sesbania bispinosa]|nr:putative disks large-like protein 2 isoform X2 [Sesbania bispinosa]
MENQTRKGNKGTREKGGTAVLAASLAGRAAAPGRRSPSPRLFTTAGNHHRPQLSVESTSGRLCATVFLRRCRSAVVCGLPCRSPSVRRSSG